MIKLLTNKQKTEMKKLFLLLVLSVLAIGIKAQTSAPVAMQTGTSYLNDKTDYTITNTTVRYCIFLAPQHFKTTQDYVVNLDSVSGNHTNVAVQLQGQKSKLKGDWTNIGSAVNWKGTTADTTIVISNTSANRYRNYRVSFTGTGTGVTKVDEQELKLWFE